ncbi:MAG: hypothetical protein H7255_15145 [Ramlibacter sp.]|nr:hypothetical protein [Ramlibacter sp.]
MPTQQEVLDTFDSLGGTFNQPMALAKALEAAGFDVSEVATAINAALAAGALVQVASGSIRKP